MMLILFKIAGIAQHERASVLHPHTMYMILY